MVELMSMLGVACAPIEEWVDVAKNSGTRAEDNNIHIQLKNTQEMRILHFGLH